MPPRSVARGEKRARDYSHYLYDFSIDGEANTGPRCTSFQNKYRFAESSDRGKLLSQSAGAIKGISSSVRDVDRNVFGSIIDSINSPKRRVIRLPLVHFCKIGQMSFEMCILFKISYSERCNELQLGLFR